MGLYTKKLKETDPIKETVKEVKKKGRPRKTQPIEPDELKEEQPPAPEPVKVEKEVQKEPEVPEPQIPVEKTPPPQQTVEEVLPLKQPTLKKKVEKKVEKVEKKKSEPKDEAPPAWFKKFISEMGYDPNESKKVNTDVAKEAATKIWNDRVKPKNYSEPQRSNPNSGALHDSLYTQIFGR